MRPRHALRVALVWRGTIMEERCLWTPGERRRLTAGEASRNDLVVSGDEIPDSFPLFRQTRFGYVLKLLPAMSGTLTSGGETHRIEPRDPRQVYVTPGDRGLLGLGDASLFFEFVRPERRPAGHPIRGLLDGTLLASLWISFVLQMAIVLIAQLVWDQPLHAEGTVGVQQLVRVADRDEEEPMPP